MAEWQLGHRSWPAPIGSSVRGFVPVAARPPLFRRQKRLDHPPAPRATLLFRPHLPVLRAMPLRPPGYFYGLPRQALPGDSQRNEDPFCPSPMPALTADTDPPGICIGPQLLEDPVDTGLLCPSPLPVQIDDTGTQTEKCKTENHEDITNIIAKQIQHLVDRMNFISQVCEKTGADMEIISEHQLPAIHFFLAKLLPPSSNVSDEED